MIDKKTIGELGLRIRRRRIAFGLTRRKLALALDVSLQDVQAFENGSRAPDQAQLDQICKILRMTFGSRYSADVGVARVIKLPLTPRLQLQLGVKTKK